MTAQETQQRLLLRVLSTDICILERGFEKLSWHFLLLGWLHLPACKGHQPPPFIQISSPQLPSGGTFWFYFDFLPRHNEVQGTKTCHGKQKGCHGSSPDLPDLPLWTPRVQLFYFPTDRSCQEASHLHMCTTCTFRWPSGSPFILNPPAPPVT